MSSSSREYALDEDHFTGQRYSGELVHPAEHAAGIKFIYAMTTAVDGDHQITGINVLTDQAHRAITFDGEAVQAWAYGLALGIEPAVYDGFCVHGLFAALHLSTTDGARRLDWYEFIAAVIAIVIIIGASDESIDTLAIHPVENVI